MALRNQVLLDAQRVGFGDDPQRHVRLGRRMFDRRAQALRRGGQDEGFVRDARQRERPLARQPCGRRGDDPQALLDQRLHVQRRCFLLSIQQRGVHIAGFEPVLQVPRIADREPQADVRVASGHLARQPRGQQIRCAGQQTDAHDAGDGPFRRLNLGLRPCDLVEDAARIFEHRLARRRQLHPVTAAIEQLGPHVLLEQTQLARHRRLHEIQQARRARDVAGFGHRDEGAQLLEIHCRVLDTEN